MQKQNASSASLAVMLSWEVLLIPGGLAERSGCVRAPGDQQRHEAQPRECRVACGEAGHRLEGAWLQQLTGGPCASGGVLHVVRPAGQKRGASCLVMVQPRLE